VQAALQVNALSSWVLGAAALRVHVQVYLSKQALPVSPSSASTFNPCSNGDFFALAMVSGCGCSPKWWAFCPAQMVTSARATAIS